MLLNTLTLAMTCSTYFQLCGNGGAREGLQDSSFLHQAVCGHWLSPVSTSEYPNFSAWMLYGERSDDAGVPNKPAVVHAAAGSARGGSSGSSSSIFNASFWWGAPAPPPPPADEGFGLGGFNASQLAELVSPVNGPDSSGSVISPVFTMWITLVALYIGKPAIRGSPGGGASRSPCSFHMPPRSRWGGGGIHWFCGTLLVVSAAGVFLQPGVYELSTELCPCLLVVMAPVCLLLLCSE